MVIARDSKYTLPLPGGTEENNSTLHKTSIKLYYSMFKAD